MKLRQGTSIIEAAVAIAVIGAILIFTITAYTNISTQSKSSEDVEIAATLASERIENLKTLKYSSLTPPAPGSLQDEINSHLTATPLNPTRFANDPNNPYSNFGYDYKKVGETENTNFYIITITVNIYKYNESDPSKSTPIIQMDCNFLRSKIDDKNAGI